MLARMPWQPEGNPYVWSQLWSSTSLFMLAPRFYSPPCVLASSNIAYEQTLQWIHRIMNLSVFYPPQTLPSQESHALVTIFMLSFTGRRWFCWKDPFSFFLDSNMHERARIDCEQVTVSHDEDPGASNDAQEWRERHNCYLAAGHSSLHGSFYWFTDELRRDLVMFVHVNVYRTIKLLHSSELKAVWKSLSSHYCLPPCSSVSRLITVFIHAEPCRFSILSWSLCHRMETSISHWPSHALF